MRNRIVASILAIVAGVAIGWFFAPREKTSVSGGMPDSSQTLRKLVAAGGIVDAERQVLEVRAVLVGLDAGELESLIDPVMKFAARRPDVNLRGEFLHRWGELAPQKALAYLGHGSLPSERTRVYTAWGRIDPDGAAESFRPLEKEWSDDFLADARALLAGIAEADAVKAIRFADRFGLADLTRLEFKSSCLPVHPTFEPSGCYQKAIEKWIRHDPAGAFDVMISLTSVKVREQALNELFFFDWPNKDPQSSHAAAIRLLERAEQEGDSRVLIHNIQLLETLMQNFGQLDGAKAYERVIGLSDPDQRLAAMSAVLRGWRGIREDRLPAVADFVAMRLSRDAIPSTEAEMLVHAAEWIAGWFTESGKGDEGIVKAAEWMDKLPAGDARDAAIRGIVSALSWLPEEQEKLVKWANALPSSHQRDVAVATCVTRILEKEPARAMDMAATMEDATLRAQALAHVAARFVSKEEGGTRVFDVRRWLRENPRIGEELRGASIQN